MMEEKKKRKKKEKKEWRKWQRQDSCARESSNHTDPAKSHDEDDCKTRRLENLIINFRESQKNLNLFKIY